MNRKFLLILVLWVAGMFFSLTGIAQQSFKNSADGISQFEGFWQGEGKFSGLDTVAQAEWEWVLSGKFFRLSIRYEMKMPDGKKQTFEGQGYYQSKGNGKYEGHWFDSQGNSYPLRGTLENGVLTSLWGENGNYNGRSIYRLSAAEKKLEIADATKQKDGSWKEFSSFKLALDR